MYKMIKNVITDSLKDWSGSDMSRNENTLTFCCRQLWNQTWLVMVAQSLVQEKKRTRTKNKTISTFIKGGESSDCF